MSESIMPRQSVKRKRAPGGRSPETAFAYEFLVTYTSGERSYIVRKSRRRMPDKARDEITKSPLVADAKLVRRLTIEDYLAHHKEQGRDLAAVGKGCSVQIIRSGIEDIREDVFEVPEGKIVLRVPMRLSKTSYEDFMAWFNLAQRKVSRTVRDDPGSPPATRQASLQPSLFDSDENSEDYKARTERIRAQSLADLDRRMGKSRPQDLEST